MWKHARTALIWLVMLAIPTQGIAAATMLSCGPNQHRSQMGAESVIDASRADGFAKQHAGERAQHHHVHATHDAHDTAAGSDSAVSVQATQDVSGMGDLDKSAKATCSACAACCSAAAIASPAVSLPAMKSSSAPILVAFLPPVGFVTDGPRRPPRSFLA